MASVVASWLDAVDLAGNGPEDEEMETQAYLLKCCPWADCAHLWGQAVEDKA